MKIRPLAAFIGAAALAAAAFAPAVTSPATTDGPGDGLAGAFAAGSVDLESDVAPGDLTDAGVPFGVTVPCTAGFAGPFPCENVDFASYVPLAELGGGAGSDSWGWVDDNDTPDDPEDDRYIVLYATTFGLTYVDVTSANAPIVLGRTTITPGEGVLWRDVKVNDDHAYLVTEEPGFGVKVIDLDDVAGAPATFANEIPVAGEWMDEDGGNAHNIWINEATDRAYVLGTGSFDDQDTGGKAQTILDLSDPANPVEIGKIDFFGYTHDMECVVYTGPDADYNGDYEGGDADGDPTNGNQAELCFGANEKFMRVVDVTDASNPSLIATIAYQSASYTHQSVLTDDMQWLMWNDETDEEATAPGTRTYWADISDLDLEMWQDNIAPPGPVNDGVHVYTHDLLTVDHNMYITGDILWQANYNGGLQVFRISDEGLANSTMERIGYFDVDPGLDIGQYGGAWNVYPHFGQDRIIVSTLDEGLYVLQTDFQVGES